MLNWLWKRIFTPDRVGYLVQIARPQLNQMMAEMVLDTMENEEVKAGIVMMGDQLYTHYSKKFFGTIGGLQKGVNSQVAEMNPLTQIIDKDGNIDVKNIISGFILGKLALPQMQGQTRSFSPSNRKILKYQ